LVAIAGVLTEIKEVLEATEVDRHGFTCKIKFTYIDITRDKRHIEQIRDRGDLVYRCPEVATISDLQ
jgi:hypothetical protein